MTNIIIIDDNWSEEILAIAKKFNHFAKKGSLRMVSFIIDKTFDILSDDKNPNQLNAAKLLQRIRTINPGLITPYISTLLDAKIGKSILDDDNFIVPDYTKYPVSDKSDDDNAIYESEGENENISISNSIESSTDEELTEKNEASEVSDMGSAITTWKLTELIQFNIVKNLKHIKFIEIDRKSSSKKCSCADGYFEKDQSDIWACEKCGAPYHENCAKIVAIFEGKCRICEAWFYTEEKKVKDNNEDTEN